MYIIQRERERERERERYTYIHAHTHNLTSIIKKMSTKISKLSVGKPPAHIGRVQ